MLVKSHGFTIMELMVVVAVVAVLSAIAAPSFRELMANTRIKTTASDIHLSLLRARSEAIKRNSNVTVAASGGGWVSGWTVSGGIETHAAIAASDLAITGTTSITYLPSGRTSSSPVAINLSSSLVSTVRCVTLTLGGHPIVKDSACP